MKKRILMVTNIWNERDGIPAFFRTIEAQTIHPVLWVWIDDGSTDGSTEVIEAEAALSPIPVRCFTLPPKQKGNIDTIGHAYNIVMLQLCHLRYDYMTIVDVDTILPRDYFATMCEVMEVNPDVGAAAGRVKGEPHRTHMPMGGGKFIRGEIVRRIERYWDLAPDSFLNIMAVKAGYRLLSLRHIEVVTTSPSRIFSRDGRFRYGRRQFYVGRSIAGAIAQAIGLLLRRDHAFEFLRGYWSEWSRGTWRCDITEVRDYYSDRESMMQLLSGKRRIVVENPSPIEKITGLFRTLTYLLLLTPALIKDAIKRVL